MNGDRVDQLLRRAADEVNAVVSSATPPPIDDLANRRSRSVVLASVLLVAAAGAGLLVVADRNVVQAPADPPIDVVTPTLSPTPDHPCELVVGISDVLADPPTSISAWVDLGVRIDELEGRVAGESSSDSSRRYDRFVALARQAAELGADGGFTPAELPAWNALAVAEDLVDYVDVPGCELRPYRAEPSDRAEPSGG